jgi:hypothetical protein
VLKLQGLVHPIQEAVISGVLPPSATPAAISKRTCATSSASYAAGSSSRGMVASAPGLQGTHRHEQHVLSLHGLLSAPLRRHHCPLRRSDYSRSADPLPPEHVFSLEATRMLEAISAKVFILTFLACSPFSASGERTGARLQSGKRCSG